MNKLELLERRNNLIEEMKSILNRCKEQKRELLKVEDEEFCSIQKQINQIDNTIINNKNQNQKTKMDSLFRNLKNIGENQNEIKNEIRKAGLQVADNEVLINVRAVTPSGGDSTVATQVADVMPQLSEASFVARAGGHVVSVAADFVIPTIDGMGLSWEEEDGTDTTATASTINTTKLVLKRLSGAFPLDKKLVDVVAPSLESAIETSIYSLIDAKINEKVIKAAEATTTVATANGFDGLVEAEGKLLLANSNPSNIVYIYNPSDLAQLKAKGKKANEILEPILKDNEIGGHLAIASAFVTAGTVIAVDASMMWANVPYVGLISDEYTLAHKGQNRICVNVYADANIANVNKYAVKVTLVKA